MYEWYKTTSRKELSSYEPDDMWTTEEHSIFLKYCPSIRDKCYHSMTSRHFCKSLMNF